MKQFVGGTSELMGKILSEPRTSLGILFLSESEAEGFAIKALVEFIECELRAFMSNKTERKQDELEYLEALKADFRKSLESKSELSQDFVANSVVAFQNFIEERILSNESE